MKILIAEDEPVSRRLLESALRKWGYEIIVATDGEEAWRQVNATDEIKLAIIDWVMPRKDGLSFCRSVRENPRFEGLYIILLTSKDSKTDMVAGLKAGADDYITKPFSPRELVARVKAVLRRAHEKPKAKILKAGQLELDVDKHLVKLKGKVVDLTSKEYELLKTLLEAHGRVLSREMLLDQVWGYDQSINIETRTVDMHIGQLRKKLKSESERILTVKNAGYRFEDGT